MAQIFVVPAEGGTAVQLTRLAYAPSQIEWTPDSADDSLHGRCQQDDEHNREPTSDLYALPGRAASRRLLTSDPGGERAPAFAAGHWARVPVHRHRGAETDILTVDISPDGTFRGRPAISRPSRIACRARRGGRPDGRAIRFDAEYSGNAHVFEAQVTGSPVVRPVTTGDRTIKGASDSRDGAWMAYVVDTPLSPAEAFVAAGVGSSEHQLTRFNAEWLARCHCSRPSGLTWKVADGTEIEGWLVKPVSYVPGRTYPMVLKIHGGPHAQYGNTWFHTFHMLSAPASSCSIPTHAVRPATVTVHLRHAGELGRDGPRGLPQGHRHRDGAIPATSTGRGSACPAAATAAS